MRRDMDLIREILMATEDGRPIKPGDFTHGEIRYHVWLLHEEGFVEAILSAGLHSPSATAPFQIFCLTWQGHEFLDAMRDETLWNKAKEKILKPGASWTAKLVFEWLKNEIKQRIMGQDS